MVLKFFTQKALIIALSVFFTFTCFAQKESDTLIVEEAGSEYVLGLFPKQKPLGIKQFQVSGFYRFFGTYTEMKDEYLLASSQTTPKRTVFIGDDSQLPNLWMNLAGRPTSNTSFGMDVFMFQFLDGDLGSSYGNQVVDSLTPNVYDPLNSTRLGEHLGLNLGINMFGSFETSIGSFTARMGGTHWYYLSDLTFASFRGYNRYTLFERNPWDPVDRNIGDRYKRFYQDGITQQDLRWGNKAFHGLILEGDNLPANFSFSFLYGKTELSGGYLVLPNTATGGRLRKSDKRGGFVSLNTFNNRTYTDSLNTASIGFNVHTLEVDKKWNDIRFQGEAGVGRYYSPQHSAEWGEAINLKLTLPKKYTLIPLEFHYYRVSPEVINNNAIFWNTSIVETSNNTNAAGAVGSTSVLQPFASSMTQLGQVTNNRTGLNLNTEINLGKLKVSAGIGSSSELIPVSNAITYSHPINQLTRSRMWRWNFPANVGPYDRYSVVYRDAYETVNLQDDDAGTVINKKHFSSVEVNAKYNDKIKGKDFYIFFLGRYNSVQPEWSPVLITDGAAYVRHYASELEVYFNLTRNLTLSGYGGYERVFGNYDTELDIESERPRNQEGIGIGGGFEISIGKNSVLVLKHRQFSFKDFSFELDQFKGKESLIELKVFF